MAVAVTKFDIREFTPAKQVEVKLRLAKVRNGEVKVPLVCPTCYSPSLESSGNARAPIRCIACSREATEELVKKVRQQRISRYLRDGVL